MRQAIYSRNYVLIYTAVADHLADKGYGLLFYLSRFNDIGQMG